MDDLSETSLAPFFEHSWPFRAQQIGGNQLAVQKAEGLLLVRVDRSHMAEWMR
jgi:hypothetical protein